MTDINVTAEDRHRFSNKQTPEQGDPDFSAKRNREIIKRTIKKADKVREKKEKEFKEGLYERSDLIYSYIRHMAGPGGNQDKTIYDYAGRDHVMSLLADQKRREILQRKFIRGQNTINFKED